MSPRMMPVVSAKISIIATTVPAVAIALAFLLILIGVFWKENVLVAFGVLFLFAGIFLQVLFLVGRGRRGVR
jgi:ABC-type multidrug transport system permease subunit